MYNVDDLIKYGFILKDNKYIYRYDIDSLYVIFTIDKNINIQVYDKDTNELFIPYNLNIETSYVSSIKEKINNIEKDIINKCFINTNIKDKLVDYIHTKYKTKEEHPWEESPLYTTFKVNDKWYALIMNIPYKSLGINRSDNIDIINLKNDPSKIEKLIDNKLYFKAYHMNKKYWMTVILNHETDLDKLKELVDDSYNIVKNK